MPTRTPLTPAQTGATAPPQVAAPQPRVTLTVAAAFALSLLIPSLLPRSAVAQGLLSGVLVLSALSMLKLGRLKTPRLSGTLPTETLPTETLPTGSLPRTERARWLVLALTSAVVTLLVEWNHNSLAIRAAELGMPSPSPTYWLVVVACALAVSGLAIGLRLLLRQGRSLARLHRGRRHPTHARPGRSRLLVVAALLVGITVTSAAAGSVDLLRPLRKPMDPQHILLTESDLGASRTMTLVEETSDPREGARLAVDRMVADGGLERSAIVVVFPTGSGWVNSNAVAAFEHQFSGDVAVVSAQFGDLPSWWSFLIDQQPAHESAETLLGEVLRRVEALPADDRPTVYVHGESLGALAGQDALSQVEAGDVCGAIWSGSPGGALSGHPRERSLHNVDDPVGYLSVDTVLHQPKSWPGLWLPGLSYGTTVLDLSSSLLPEPGHGHVYGPEQDWTLPDC